MADPASSPASPGDLFQHLRVQGHLPVPLLTAFLRAIGHQQIIVVTWDGEREHVATQGLTLGDADNAAEGGNLVKKALGWPENLRAKSARYIEFLSRVLRLLAVLREADLMPDQAVGVQNAMLAVEEALQPGWRL